MRIGHSPGAFLFLPALLLLSALSGCYALRPSTGAGQTQFNPPRTLEPADVALPAGYRIEVVASGLTFPTGIAFDSEGTPHIVESGYAYGEVWTTPRLLRIEDGGRQTVVASGARNGPWNGLAFHDGAFYVSEGGQMEGGRILRITPEGDIRILIEDLPGRGDHHVNGPVVGPDGRVYFSVGTATNSGIVGEDNASFGWLHRWPQFRDIPCKDVVLSGQNFRTRNPLREERVEVETGAFSPFGHPTRAGQVIEGRVPCTGAIMSIPPDGGSPELVAWGFRNPFGLAFSPAGELFATDNGYDDRGSRPVWGAGDLLWQVDAGLWHGWPDFSGARPLSRREFKPPGKTQPTFVLADYPNPPPPPVAVLGVHSSSNGLDFSRNETFGFVEHAFIAQFGDMAPAVGKVMKPVGAKVVRVDVLTGDIQDFAVNHGPVNAPASWLGTGGLERPVAARFDPDGTSLYVVDFGVMLQQGGTSIPQSQTGVVWRIRR